LDCSFNKLTKLPEFNNAIYTGLSIGANNIKTVPKSFPKCGHNSNIFEGTPIQDKINKYYDGNKYIYLKEQQSVDIIENWYLEVRFNPSYIYCQRKETEKFNELVNIT